MGKVLEITVNDFIRSRGDHPVLVFCYQDSQDSPFCHTREQAVVYHSKVSQGERHQVQRRPEDVGDQLRVPCPWEITQDSLNLSSIKELRP